MEIKNKQEFEKALQALAAKACAADKPTKRDVQGFIETIVNAVYPDRRECYCSYLPATRHRPHLYKDCHAIRQARVADGIDKENKIFEAIAQVPSDPEPAQMGLTPIRATIPDMLFSDIPVPPGQETFDRMLWKQALLSDPEPTLVNLNPERVIANTAANMPFSGVPVPDGQEVFDRMLWKRADRFKPPETVRHVIDNIQFNIDDLCKTNETLREKCALFEKKITDLEIEAKRTCADCEVSFRHMASVCPSCKKDTTYTRWN